MMLFKPEHVEKILAGQKTETRRIWKKQHAKVGSIHLAKTKMLSKEFFAKLRILEVEQQRLGDISDEEVRREGYSRIEDFISIWFKINKNCWEPDQIVYAIRFEVVS